MKYAIPELNDMEEENVFRNEKEIEEDDDMTFEQFKKLDMNEEETGFSDEEKKKEKEGGDNKTEKHKEEVKQEEKPEEEEEEEEEVKEEEKVIDEYAGLGGKKGKVFQNKSKRKSSKLEKKEREVHRMVNSRKKSEFDDNF